MSIENMIRVSQRYIRNSKLFQFAERIGFYDWLDNNYWPHDNRAHILALKTSRKVAPWALIIGVPWAVFDADSVKVNVFNRGDIVEAISEEFYRKEPDHSRIVKDFKYGVIVETPYQTCKYNKKADFDALKGERSVMVKDNFSHTKLKIFGYEFVTLEVGKSKNDNCGYSVKG